MKTKFFTRMLTGALLIASVGSFVSCKDYDDDINNLQEQINKAALKEDLTSLSSTLTTAITNAKAAADNAKAAADAAREAADSKVSKTDYEAAVAALRTEAENSGRTLAAAITAVGTAAQDAKDSLAAEVDAAKEAARQAADAAAEVAARAKALEEAGYAKQTDVDRAVKQAADAAADAKQAAADAEKNAREYADTKAAATLEAASTAANSAITVALAAYDAAAQVKIKAAIEEALKSNNLDQVPADLKEQLEKLAELQKDLGKATELKQTVEDLRKDLDKLTEETIPQMKVSVEKYKTQIEELYQAVTSVSLYVSQTGRSFQGANSDHKTVPIIFVTAKQKSTKFPATAGITDYQAQLIDDNVTVTREVLVRVSPTSAQLRPEMISLVNSLGDPISKSLVDVRSVEPYDELITRAGSSGIWKVTFKLQDGYRESDFKAAVEKNHKSVVFALAVNNTSASELGYDRQVVSEYDIVVNAGEARPAYSFNVNDWTTELIHNRFHFTEQGIGTNYLSGYTTKSKHVPEINWRTSTPQYPTPAMVANDNNSGDRAYNADLTSYPYYDVFGHSGYANGYDNRQYQPILSVVQGERIDIEFPYLERFEAVAYFYVTLDSDFAKESNNSEINAWTSYSYENVGYKDANGNIIPAKLQEGNRGWITINNLNNVQGDVIGFRVYAINLDGTLVDPDGRAFYVKVGGEVRDRKISDSAIEVTATGQWGDVSYQEFTIGKGFFSDDVNNYTLTWGDNNEYVRQVISGTSQLVLPIEGETSKYQTQKSEEVNGDYVGNLIGVQIWDEASKAWVDITTVPGLNLPDDQDIKARAYINQTSKLLDGATYHLTLAANNTEYLVDEPVETIDIAVTKVLPKGIPAELTVKEGQAANIRPLKVYMKPLTGGWSNDWDVAGTGNIRYGMDVRPFDLADIFNDIKPTGSAVTSYYGFEFTNSDVNNDKKNSTYADYNRVRSWDGTYNYYNRASLVSNSYSIPYAGRDIVKDGSTVDVYTTYTYNQVSLTKQKYSTSSDIWEPKVDDCIRRSEKATFTVKYISALNAAGIKVLPDASIWTNYGVPTATSTTYTAAKQTTDRNNAVKNFKKYNFTVTYENGGLITLDSLVYTPYTITGLTAATAATAAHTNLPTAQTGTLASLLKNGYLEITGVKLVSDYIYVDDSSRDFGYYPSVSNLYTGQTVSAIKINAEIHTGAATLQSAVNYNLVITVRDTFGVETDITVPITMEKPVAI